MARRRGVFAEIQHERKARQRERERQMRVALQDAARERKTQERRAREAQRQAAADEAARKGLHVAERKAEAEAKTSEVEARISELDGVLDAALIRPTAITFDRLRKDVPLQPFDPGRLGRRMPPPRWEDYAPERPGIVRRAISAARLRQAVEDAQQSFEADLAAHADAEKADQQELARRRRDYARYKADATRQHILGIHEWEDQFRLREPEAVARFFTTGLEESEYPDGFPDRSPVVAYDPVSGKLMVDQELPRKDIIPTVRGYRYVQTRDETDALPRPAREVAAQYGRLISQVGLRTIHEVLAADPAEVVDSVAFNGRLSTVNKATGRPDRPYLLSLFVDREQFDSLVLANVDPVACVKALGAHMSPHPFEIEDVKPIVDTEAFLAQFNFIDGADVIAGLDSRLDLLDLSPWDFETFVKELFTGRQLPEGRRLKVWQTQEVSDDGVDAVAVNDDPVFGGNVVIQAKKYSKAVPPAAIRELMGSMADKHATKGILVTTSWVGPKGVAQAKRDGRIDIIDCHGLMSMCREQGLDVLIGLPNPPPASRRPSDPGR